MLGDHNSHRRIIEGAAIREGRGVIRDIEEYRVPLGLHSHYLIEA